MNPLLSVLEQAVMGFLETAIHMIELAFLLVILGTILMLAPIGWLFWKIWKESRKPNDN